MCCPWIVLVSCGTASTQQRPCTKIPSPISKTSPAELYYLRHLRSCACASWSTHCTSSGSQSCDDPMTVDMLRIASAGPCNVLSSQDSSATGASNVCLSEGSHSSGAFLISTSWGVPALCSFFLGVLAKDLVGCFGTVQLGSKTFDTLLNMLLILVAPCPLSVLCWTVVCTGGVISATMSIILLLCAGQGLHAVTMMRCRVLSSCFAGLLWVLRLVENDYDFHDLCGNLAATLSAEWWKLCVIVAAVFLKPMFGADGTGSSSPANTILTRMKFAAEHVGTHWNGIVMLGADVGPAHGYEAAKACLHELPMFHSRMILGLHAMNGPLVKIRQKAMTTSFGAFFFHFAKTNKSAMSADLDDGATKSLT